MKIIFVFSVCCLAVVLASSFDFNKRLDEKYKSAETECREKLKQGEKKVEETKGCFEACVYEKMSYFNEDGTLNYTWIPAGHEDNPRSKDFREHAQRVYTRCLETGKGDSCKVAYCMANTKEF